MRRSQDSAIDSPAPAAAPSSCATTGLLIWCRMRDTSMPLRRVTCFSSKDIGARPAAIDLTSPPTQNVPPAPLSSTARTSESSAARRAASTSPRVMSGLSALRRSGRFMVMVSRPLSRCCRTISLAVMACVLCSCLLLTGSRHCEERKRRSNPFLVSRSGLLRFARNDGARPLFLHQRAARLFQRLERLVAGDGRQQLVIVPAALGLRRFLYLEQIHVVHHAAVLADAAVLGEHVVDRGLLHDLDDGGRIGGARGLHRLQVMRDGGIDAGLSRGRHALDALHEAL